MLWRARLSSEHKLTIFFWCPVSHPFATHFYSAAALPGAMLAGYRGKRVADKPVSQASLKTTYGKRHAIDL